MRYSMRWYGPGDPVSLEWIRQVPGLDGIVTALDDFPPGEVWTPDAITERQQTLARHGFEWLVTESVPVHESIKLGEPERDRYIERFAQSVQNLGAAGVTVLCYNFMPVFDWFRTDLALPLADGSTTMQYREAELARYDLTQGMERRAFWPAGFSGTELSALLARYRSVDAERLLEHLRYFLRAVVPVAEAAGVRLAIHPDDPPWPIFGLPRIVSDAEGIRQVLDAVDSPSNGLTLCTGALGALPANDLTAMAEAFGPRVNFVHARNVRRTGDREFHEVAHAGHAGDVDLVSVLVTLLRSGYGGPIRPDHGRMVWGETGTPGYGLYDRAMGVTYLQGVVDGLQHRRQKP